MVGKRDFSFLNQSLKLLETLPQSTITNTPLNKILVLTKKRIIKWKIYF